MTMAKFTVDTTNKLFIAKAGVTSFSVKVDLYSDAKEHWLAGGTALGFDFPVRAIGGDPIGGGKNAGDLYFLRDGWKIRPDEVDHTLIIDGNLFLDEGETGSLVVPTLGDFTVLSVGERSNLVQTVEIQSGSGADWTNTEKEHIRHRLGIDGTSSAPVASPSLSRPGDAMALTSNERNSVANVLLDLANAIEAGLTLRQAMRVALAILAGKVSGAETSILTFRNAVADTKGRVVATVDAQGNRTGINYDAE